MKLERLQRPKVALQPVILLILDDFQEEGPHALENTEIEEPVQNINRLIEV
jgi:hypothetical protein